MDETPKIRAHLYIQGKVQGVFYRSWTHKTASELGLFGWVKNLTDGKVEAVFEGEKSLVEKMVDYCRQGSKQSEVTHIDVVWEEPSGDMYSFKVIS